MDMNKWYKFEPRVLFHLLSKLKKVREKMLILKITLKAMLGRDVQQHTNTWYFHHKETTDIINLKSTDDNNVVKYLRRNEF